MQPASARLGPRAERTRAALLEAAEQLFAERGFASTRLEDVALRVGIRRASIIYYFRDKPELYDEVLGSAIGDLLARIEAVFRQPGSLRARIDAAIAAWVEFVGGRPAVARLLLRELADTGPEGNPCLRRHLAPVLDFVARLRAQRGERAPLVSDRIDPLHLASALAGATLFFVGALPGLAPGFALDPARLAGHRDELLRIAARLIDEPTHAEGGRA